MSITGEILNLLPRNIYLIASNIPGDIITFLGNDILILVERQTGGRNTVGWKDRLMDVLRSGFLFGIFPLIIFIYYKSKKLIVWCEYESKQFTSETPK